MSKFLKFRKCDFKPDIRRLQEMKEVIFDKKWFKKTAPNLEVYYMYRGFYKSIGDKEKMEKAGLRYDITIIPARKFGDEFPKTIGHFHNFPKEGKFSYPEIYQVLSGKALFLFQKSKGNKVFKILAIEARKGDIAIIPPNYGHLTINIGKNDLAVANWMAVVAKSDYRPFIKNRGAAYYALNSNGKIKWLINKNYSLVPKIKFIKPMNYLFRGKKNIYDLITNLQKLEFLSNPKKFKNLWRKIER